MFTEFKSSYQNLVNPQSRLKFRESVKYFAKALIDKWFDGGCTGLELANYFKDFPNPYTEKKMRCIKGQ